MSLPYTVLNALFKDQRVGRGLYYFSTVTIYDRFDVITSYVDQLVCF